MIKNSKLLDEFEKEFIQENSLSYEESLALLGGMWEMGIALGVLPPKDPWGGIEVDIKVAIIT